MKKHDGCGPTSRMVGSKAVGGGNQLEVRSGRLHVWSRCSGNSIVYLGKQNVHYHDDLS